MSTCPKCKTELVAIPCGGEAFGTCTVQHLGCPRCRAVPCMACGGQRAPEAEHGLCDACRRAGAVWAARMALLPGIPSVRHVHLEREAPK